MAEYIAYFIEDPRQLWALGSVAILWLGMTAIGHLLVRDDEEVVIAPLVGWAVVVAAYTILGTLTSMSFTTIAIGLSALAVVSGIMALRRDALLFDPIWLRMLVLAAPLLILVSAMQGSQWDEFSHWLTGQAYLLRVDAFPGEGRPTSAASYAGYPYGWQILGYLPSRLAGVHIESAAPLLNILLLLTLGRVAIGWVLRYREQTIHDLTISPWVIAGLAGLSVTLINPTFVQKVILTAYADSATSTSLALGFVFGILALKRFEENDSAAAWRAAAISALCLSILVTLKQSTLELFLLALIGLTAFGVTGGWARITKTITTVGLISIPGFVLYFAWRAYVANNLAGEEFSFLPFDEWNIDLIPTILMTMSHVLLKKSAYLLAVLIAVFWGARILFERTSANRFMLAVSLIFVGHITFLFLCYVAVFSGHEARTAASFWRYNQQLGGFAVLVMVVTLGLVIFHYGERFNFKRLRYVPLVLLVLAPFLAAHKLRFDADPIYHHYRAVGSDMINYVEQGQTVFLLDPKGSGESALISQFETSALSISYPYLSVYHDHSATGIANFWKGAAGHLVLIHSVTPELNEALGQSFDVNTSYLVRANVDGTPDVIASWPWPEVE